MNTVIKIGIGILVGAAGALGGRALVERRRGRPAPLPESSAAESVAPNGATATAMPASDALEAS